jgi:hypothetical protein
LRLCYGQRSAFLSRPKKNTTSGFFLYEVVAEAGLHPDKPEGVVQKTPTIDGHAYWLRSVPIFSSGVDGVKIFRKGCGRVEVDLYLTAAARKSLFEYSTSSSENAVAIVLDGRIVAEPTKIIGPLNVKYYALPDMDSVEAMVLVLEIQRANIPTAVQN